MATISNRLQVNRFFLPLAKSRTSHVSFDPESKRNLHRIPLIPRVQGDDSKIGLNGVQSYPNLRQKFQHKRPLGFANYHANIDSNDWQYTLMAQDNADKLKKILSEEVPLCTGVVPLDTNNSRLFYRNAVDGSLGLIDFSTVVSDNQLEQLAQACQPATYGVPQQDVLDESYRKAGKLDAVNFSTNFNPNSTASGIMEAIRSLLLKDPKSSVQVKLHKLNVYGPGSFFKAHVDTPKSGKMFGSLVVVLPTKHEGGTFPLRHDNREWVFNSADLVSPQNTESPRAAFVAFFGDIEHEVTEVISGYRVTLTYNLYFGDDESTTGMTIVPSTMLPIDDTEVKIKELLISLLNNPKFLSDGGLVGFGLSHLYPISSENINLLELGENLKGIDAAIKRACDSLSLNISVKMVYNSDIEGVSCLLDDIADPGTDAMVDEEDVLVHLQQYSDGLLVYDQDWLSKKDLEFIKNAEPISWLKPFTERNELESPYVAYGNQLSGTLGYRDVYGEVCLVLTVDAYNDRKTYQL